MAEISEGFCVAACMFKTSVLEEVVKGSKKDLNVLKKFMKEVKVSLEKGENVYLRGFGSFIIKTRAEKTGRNISKNVAIKIPAHNIPSFKPAKIFVQGVKSKVPVSK